MITSVQNNQVKNIIKLNQKAKARKDQGLFIAEGRKMFLEAPLSWIEKIYVAEAMTTDDVVMEKAKKNQFYLENSTTAYAWPSLSLRLTVTLLPSTAFSGLILS